MSQYKSINQESTLVDIRGALWLLFDPCDADLVRHYFQEEEKIICSNKAIISVSQMAMERDLNEQSDTVFAKIHHNDKQQKLHIVSSLGFDGISR